MNPAKLTSPVAGMKKTRQNHKASERLPSNLRDRQEVNPLYRSLHVCNFRCLRDVTADGLKRVNLIAGENNAGKTALLEALFLHTGAFNPTLVIPLAGLRGIETFRIQTGLPINAPWSSLFSDLDESKEISLVARDAAGHCRSISIRTIPMPDELRVKRDLARSNIPAPSGALVSPTRSEVLRWHYSGAGREDIVLLSLDQNGFRIDPPSVGPPPFLTRFLSARWNPDFRELAEMYGDLEVRNEQEGLLEILRMLEPKLTRMSVVVIGETPMLHADIGMARLVPAAFLGDGVLRLAKLVLNMIHTAGGVLLVDEIENGFHYSHLPQIWAALAKSAARFAVQLFATTHSRECIVAAHSAFSQNFDYDFSLLRLERSNGQVRAVIYDQESLEGAIEADFEVR